MNDLEPHVRAALDSFKAKLAAELGSRVRRLALFGSVARGTARWDSDVDVLVLLDTHTWQDECRILDLAADELPVRGVLLSPTVMSVAEYDELQRRERRLPGDIERDGVPL